MADDLEQHEASMPAEARQQAPGEGAAVEDFLSTDDIFRRVLATAAHELERPASIFIWGSLAAGLIVGFSFLARAVVSAEVQGLPLLVENLYPIGFIFVILGRYPLYIENTLTPVTLALTRFASLRGRPEPFLIPVTLGNTVAGVVFVAVFNWAQFSAEKGHGTDLGLRLLWREWLLGRKQLGRHGA